MSEHTPGPWHIQKAGNELNIVSDSDTVVAYDIQATNDALVIAAAPDLLAACQFYLRDDIDANDAPLIEDAIRQAVAKAEGHG